MAKARGVMEGKVSDPTPRLTLRAGGPEKRTSQDPFELPSQPRRSRAPKRVDAADGGSDAVGFPRAGWDPGTSSLLWYPEKSG